MAKKKKTREQKKIAEINRNKQLTATYKFSFTPPVKSQESNVKNINSKEIKTQTTNIATTKTVNDFLISDLRKTIFVTIIILGLQVILSMFIK